MRLLILFFGLVLLSVINSPALATADEFTQPINFSHQSHAGDNEIPCEFCHIYSRRSNHSGMPPTTLCTACHQTIAGSTDIQKQEIAEMMVRLTQGGTIPWKKIHDLPDFVYFSHQMHIKAGFDCTECHGEIFNRPVITMQNMTTDLSMGWCIQCHEQAHPARQGQRIGPSRQTRGAKAESPGPAVVPDGTISRVNNCLSCHK